MIDRWSGVRNLVGAWPQRKESAPWDWQPLRIPLSILGALAIVASFVLAKSHGYDLASYWHIAPDPYRSIESLTGETTFRYAPPLILVFRPLELLSWEAVQVVWLGLQLAALAYIGRSWALVLVLFPPVWLDVVYGNVNIFLAAAVVAGLRYPGAWAFVLLTKVTPGVGVLSFLTRREWRSLAVAAGGTALIVGLSLAVQGPELWASWIASLAHSTTLTVPPDALPIPLLPRLFAAAGLVAWGGLTDRRWTVPIAVTLAMPTLWVIALTPLVALAKERRTA